MTPEEEKKQVYDEDDEKSAFMEGYNDEEEAPECEECGSAIIEKSVSKELEGEKHTFCSEHCAEEFEESMG